MPRIGLAGCPHPFSVIAAAVGRKTTLSLARVVDSVHTKRCVL
jgi:hypothetical protein